jgi:hypothetical protein
VEKDFWVCWTLGRIFDDPELAPHLVFKGGTSLSKVFGVIQRFSEDIDLSIAPEWLGRTESDLDEAPSRNRRERLNKELQAACGEMVANQLRQHLETRLQQQLGARSDRSSWLSHEVDASTQSPVLLFEYPSALMPMGGYISPVVKLEFGSLTDQRPTGSHVITPVLAEVIPQFDDDRAEVIALEVERTFWEKATILHAEYHRPAGQPIRDRYARHYSDVAALWRHPARELALERLDLLERVATHKSRFFASSWASYDTARPGSLRLSPPADREAELARDYARMEPMFLTSPPPFAQVLEILREAEREINGR